MRIVSAIFCLYAMQSHSMWRTSDCRIRKRESAPRSPVVPCRKHVLIVDDNAFVRRAFSEIFRKEADFDVCGEAENGYEAVRRAQLLRPDLIALGLAMPVMNGLEAARVLKRLMPAIPLIKYSGFEDKFVEQQAQFIGIAA